MTKARVCACGVFVCLRLQPLEADGAEQEDGVEQHEPKAQPAVQLPAVQMDAQDLKHGKKCNWSFPVIRRTC